jgi:hypothetical protein
MNTTTEDVLAKLGLQTRTSVWGYLLPVLGIFGFGMLVGTGVTLLSMPRVRKQLSDRLQRGAARMRGAKHETIDDAEEQPKPRGANGDGRTRVGTDHLGVTHE